MTLKDSTELLGVFDTALMEIKGSSPLSSSDRRRIADDLSEVYNYVSASIQKPSFTNAIYQDQHMTPSKKYSLIKSKSA